MFDFPFGISNFLRTVCFWSPAPGAVAQIARLVLPLPPVFLILKMAVSLSIGVTPRNSRVPFDVILPL
jgi:hypothetical protein